MAVEILVDSVQSRLSADPVSTLVGGLDWDIAASSNIYQDGVTSTVFLAPGCTLPNWYTSNSGIYAKLPISDYTLSPSYSAGPPPNWTEMAPNPDGAPFIRFMANSSGAGAITTYSVPENQAIVWEVSTFLTTSGRSVLGDVGWGSSGDYTTGVSLRFYTDNTVDVYKAGNFVGQYTVSGQQPTYGQSNNQIPQQPAGSYNLFMLIPCRERELLVISSNGGGFSVIFDDIPEGTVGAEITPNAPIWFYAAPGVDSFNRLALCKYASSGHAIGKRSKFRYDPGASPSGGFQAYIDRTEPSGCSATLLVADGITPSVAYANNVNGVRLNVTLNGTGDLTPFIYGARGYTLAITSPTVGPPLDITEYALSLSYDCPDSFAGTRSSLTITDPLKLEAQGVALDGTNQPGSNIGVICERPFQIKVDDVLLIEAFNESPEFKDGARIMTPIESSPGEMTYGTLEQTNANQFVSLQLMDAAQAANNFVFKETIPFDGLSVADAYRRVCSDMGWATPIISPALETVYVSQAGNTTTKFNLQTESGDKGLEWLERLAKTYAANWFHSVVTEDGVFKSQLIDPSLLPTTPVVHLYDCEATAIAAGVASPTYKDLFRTSDVKMLKPEANDIYVQGYDNRTKRPILAHKFDSVSADPTIIPALRTPSWRGQRISCTWIDPTICDIDTAVYCCQLLYDRLTIARSLAEIEAEFNPLITKGQVVRLHFKSGGGIKSAIDGTLQNPVDIRIKTISSRFTQTGNGGGERWIPTKYIGDANMIAAPLHTRGTSLEYISQEWLLRTTSKTVSWGSVLDKQTWSRPLITQSVA